MGAQSVGRDLFSVSFIINKILVYVNEKSINCVKIVIYFLLCYLLLRFFLLCGKISNI